MQVTINKKMIKFITISLMVLFILFFRGFFKILYSSIYEYFVPLKPPERLENIPKTAVWYGGRDRGEWFDYQSIDNNDSCFECNVYNDYNGDEISDNWWDTDIYCIDSGKIKIEELRNITRSFDGVHIELKDGRVLKPDFSNFNNKLESIRIGMTKGEVIDLFGQFFYKMDYTDSLLDIWTYYIPTYKKYNLIIYFDKSTDLVVKTLWEK